MWAVSFLAFLANPVLGVVLLISAAVTTGIKVAAVDAQFAKRGEMPPTARLVEKWLDGRKAAGAAPADAKVKKYGSWAYAWQRWHAMWEDLGEKHRETRAAHKAAVEEAKRTGQPVPVKPKLMDRLAGWKWSIPNLIAPVGEPKPQQPASGPGPAQQPRIACDECGVTLVDADGGWEHPTGSPCRKRRPAGDSVPLTCPKCGQRETITPSGWCEPCTVAGPHGFCHCDGVVRLDGDVWRHGGHWPCPTRLPAAGHTSPCTGCGTPLPMHPSMAELGMTVRCGACRGNRGAGASSDPDRQRGSTAAPSGGDLTRSGDIAAASAAALPQRLLIPAGGNTPAPETNQQGDTMTQPVPSGEVTGTRSAVVYANTMAAVHAQHGSNEGYLTSLGSMDVGDGDLGLVRDAMQASKLAGEKWKAAADSIEKNNAGLREHYANAPDAANKAANINE